MVVATVLILVAAMELASGSAGRVLRDVQEQEGIIACEAESRVELITRGLRTCREIGMPFPIPLGRG